MPRLHFACFAIIALLLMGLASKLQEPTFHSEDPGALHVKTLKVAGALSGMPSALVSLEVSNPTKFWAEPTEFEVQNKGRGKDAQKVLVARVASPYFGRFGRAIEPGGKLTYQVNVPLASKDIQKGSVRVTHASFFEGTPLLEAPIVVGKIDEGEPEQNFVGGSTRFSRILLENTSELVVDAILLAKFSGPKNGKTLIQCRLQPGEERRWTVEGSTVRWPLEPDERGSVIKSVELVDWSAQLPEGDERARELLKEAYEARVAWPSEKLKYSARYELEVSEHDYGSNKRVVRKERGRLTSEGGYPQFHPESGGEGRSEGWILLDRANKHLGRAPFDEWLDGGTPFLHTIDGGNAVVAVLHEGQKSYADAYHWIEDGQLTGQARSPRSRTQTSKWFQLKVADEGTLVIEEVERMVEDIDPKYPKIYAYEYSTIDGVPIPTTLRRERHFNPIENSSFVDLVLTDVRIEDSTESDAGSANQAAPTGPLADRVRAAWERGYRYPDEAVDLNGSFTVTNPGNDLSWQGHRKVEGTFTLLGYKGASWDSWEMELDGKYTEATAAQLKQVVEDRLRMYSGRRDHCGRKSFDEAFAGARLEEVGRKIMVHDCSIQQVEIKKDRLNAYWQLGERRLLKWTKRGDTEIITKITGKRESMTYERKNFDGWWIPVDVKMKDVFEDWGPERVKLKDLVLSKK